MATPLNSANSAPDAQRFLKPDEVMGRFAYQSRSAFLVFVKRVGIPHLRMNARRILFDPQQVEDWITKHTVGGSTR